MCSRRTLSVWVALSLLAALPVLARADEKDAPKTKPDPVLQAIESLRTELHLAIQAGKSDAKQETAALRKRLSKLELNLDSLVKTMEGFQKEQSRLSSYFIPGQPGNGGATEEAVQLTLDARVRRLESEQRRGSLEITDLKAQLRSLEDRVNALERGSRPPALTQDTGTLVLDNSRLGQSATFIVNGTPYRVGPFQTQRLTGYQAGAFTFEVLVDGFGSLQPAVTRTLLKDREYRLFTYLR